MKRLFLCLNILIFSILHINATQITVDYYGVLTTSDNTNILKMAQDIFYTQLCSIDNITTNDKRLDTSKTLASAPNTDNIQANTDEVLKLIKIVRTQPRQVPDKIL